MTRRMSCSMTIDAVKAHTKTVTRRHVDTWKTLKPGDRLTLIEKGMGLPKGARQVVLAEVEIVRNEIEPVGCVNHHDLVSEGLPEMTVEGFVVMWLKSHGYPNHLDAMTICRRIEWRYIE